MIAWAKVAIWAGIFAAGLALGWVIQGKRLADARTEHANVLRDIAAKTLRASELARAAERDKAGMLDAIATFHQKELADVEAKHDAVVAGLRAGTVRLQDRWTCPPARVSGPATAAGEPHGRTDDRAEGAARIVRYAAECDAQVRGLQAVVKADRQP